MSRSLAELDAYKVLHLDMENNLGVGTPTDVEWKPTNRGMKPKLDGATSKIVVGDVYNGVKSIAFYAHISSTTEYLLDLNGTENIDINAGTVRANNVTSPTIYVDGVSTTSLSDVTGFHHITITTATGINVSALVIGLIGANYGAFRCDDLIAYSETLDATETLSLYNSIKAGHGILRHETSFTHRLSPEVDSSTVFATDMRTKNADRTLVDLSGNSNHGTVAGAVRSGGHFTDGLRFDGVDDNINVPTSSELDLTESGGTCEAFAHVKDGRSLIVKAGTGFSNGYWLSVFNNTPQMILLNISTIKKTLYGSTVSDGIHHLVGTWDEDEVSIYCDGVHLDTVQLDGFTFTTDNTRALTLGIYADSAEKLWDDSINFAAVVNVKSSAETIKSRFNFLAVLPLYSIEFSRYPSNITVYDSIIPYSSMRVESGSFKIDGSQLVCVTDGIIEMRNAHDFDGSEYITLTIDGVEYSGTGTVTQGTITASITQGSNLISIDADAADVIDKVNIQFRALVA